MNFYRRLSQEFFIFFFNDTATTEIYTLSLHDALPIYPGSEGGGRGGPGHQAGQAARPGGRLDGRHRAGRSEEHTSELQSQSNLVCRLLLEKKKLLKTVHLTKAEIIALGTDNSQIRSLE